MSEARVETPFIFVTPQGVRWLGLADCISHAWQIALGWPDEAEINEAKSGGCFIAPATVRFKDLRGGDHHKRTVILAGVPHDGRCLEAASEIERLRLALREIVRMAAQGADAPMTAERWLDRIDETAINALSQEAGE